MFFLKVFWQSTDLSKSRPYYTSLFLQTAFSIYPRKTLSNDVTRGLEPLASSLALNLMMFHARRDQGEPFDVVSLKI